MGCKDIKIRIRIRVCGNYYITFENGFYFLIWTNIFDLLYSWIEMPGAWFGLVLFILVYTMQYMVYTFLQRTFRGFIVSLLAPFGLKDFIFVELCWLGFVTKKNISTPYYHIEKIVISNDGKNLPFSFNLIKKFFLGTLNSYQWSAIISIQ